MSQSDEAIAGDSCDGSRLGLDHLSLSVGSMADLHAAVRLFDEKGIPHGETTPLEPFDSAVEQGEMAFRDPDNIQVELTAPPGGSDRRHENGMCIIRRNRSRWCVWQALSS